VTTDAPRFVITLSPMPDPSGIDPVRRLAQLLKLAGRRFKLRCLDAREARPDAPPMGNMFPKRPTASPGTPRRAIRPGNRPSVDSGATTATPTDARPK
jgi:hypothetical protein